MESVALQNLTLSIHAGQKIIVCGRTGRLVSKCGVCLLMTYHRPSGKSTLLLTLLRIIELRSGSIELDGVDISHVRLELIRERGFVTVSQETLLLSNETVRFNLNPDATISDDVIIEALVKVGLWTHLSGGMDAYQSCQ